MNNKLLSVDKSDYHVISERRLWVHKSINLDDFYSKSKSIYIYTKASDYISRLIIKIGETGTLNDRSVMDRLYEQPNSTDTEPLLLLCIIDCKSYIAKGIIKDSVELESYLHREFNNCRWDGGAGTEWFRVGIEDVINLCKVKLRDNNIVRKDFVPHFLQELTLNQFMDSIENEFSLSVGLIAELCARFGKTLLYLELFNRLENDILIIPSYVHTVFTSFENEILGDYGDEEIGKWTNFNGFKIIDTTVDNMDWVDKLDKNLGKSKLIIFVSLQTREESFSKFDVIRSISSDRKIILIDEADYGAWTEKSQKVIDYIV